MRQKACGGSLLRKPAAKACGGAEFKAGDCARGRATSAYAEQRFTDMLDEAAGYTPFAHMMGCNWHEGVGPYPSPWLRRLTRRGPSLRRGTAQVSGPLWPTLNNSTLRISTRGRRSPQGELQSKVK